LLDNDQVWLLQPDGRYLQAQHKDSNETIQAQTKLLNELQGN